MKSAGTIILIIGLFITGFTGFQFGTTKKVADIGSLEITHDKKHNWAWSPLLGVAMIVIGGGFYLYGERK